VPQYNGDMDNDINHNQRAIGHRKDDRRRGDPKQRDLERKAAGTRIDPKTAFVWFEYAQTLDPYGDGFDLGEYEQIGREWFAADPVEGFRVHWHDLPEETQDALEEQRRAEDTEGWRRLLQPC
jgi:hypothetical protein